MAYPVFLAVLRLLPHVYAHFRALKHMAKLQTSQKTVSATGRMPTTPSVTSIHWQTAANM
jgi:hypothetical protein